MTNRLDFDVINRSCPYNPHGATRAISRSKCRDWQVRMDALAVHVHTRQELSRVDVVLIKFKLWAFTYTMKVVADKIEMVGIKSIVWVNNISIKSCACLYVQDFVYVRPFSKVHKCACTCYATVFNRRMYSIQLRYITHISNVDTQ
jgi:hypothetical protein